LEYVGDDLVAMAHADTYHRWIADEFRPYLGDRVAEVGAGIGNFSKALLRAGVRTLFSFEPSDNLYPLLQAALSGSEAVHTIHGYFDEGCRQCGARFDTVVYVNVLEHIEDDGRELSHVHRALARDGHVCIFVPALAWLYGEFDKSLGHFRRYYRKDLAQLVERCGFDIVKMRYFDIAGIVPWYVTLVLLKRSVTARNVLAYDRIVVPLMRAVEGAVPPPVGKNLLCVARKLG
jgi:SAM-dependent methyltransferase